MTRRGDVTWHLPNPRTGTYFKTPFAHSTTAQSDLARMLAGDGLTFAQAVAAINYDDELKAILAEFVAAGHGNTFMKDMIRI